MIKLTLKRRVCSNALLWERGRREKQGCPFGDYSGRRPFPKTEENKWSFQTHTQKGGNKMLKRNDNKNRRRLACCAISHFTPPWFLRLRLAISYFHFYLIFSFSPLISKANAINHATKRLFGQSVRVHSRSIVIFKKIRKKFFLFFMDSTITTCEISRRVVKWI